MKENSTCWKKYYVYTGVNSYNQTGKGDDRVMFFTKAPRYHNDRTEQQKPAAAESKVYTNDYRLSLMKHNQQCIVNRLINKIEEAGNISESLIGMIGDINKYVEFQVNVIEKVTGEVSGYSALAQEVYASTDDSRQISAQTAEAAQQGDRAVEDSIRAMNEIESSVQETKQFIQDLSEKADSIYEMLNVIKDIASSTNLLSLNASIEAARAGEAGRGFAVVAQEVKKLAQHSVQSTEYISKTVEEINKYIQETMSSMDRTIERVKEGTKIADNTREAFQTIIDAIKRNNDISQEISEAISQQTNSLENIVRSIDDMSHTFEKLLSLVETASSGTQYTKTSLQSLHSVSKDLQSVTDRLLKVLEAEPYERQTLRTCIPSKIATYDPFLSCDFVTGLVLENVHNGLLSIGNDGEVSPAIAKSWSLKEDNLTWVFNLRKGAKFHSGREVTAWDVKYSFERLLNPSLNSPNSWCLLYVEGAEEYMQGNAPEVTGIKVIDDYRISIRLKYPYTGFLLNLGQYICCIVDKEEMEKGNIVGCGPYKIAETSDTKCVLEAHEEYFNGQPYVDRFEIDIAPRDAAANLLDGKYHYIIVDTKELMSRVKDKKDISIKSRSISGSYYVGFNLNSPNSIVREKEVRKALNMAVNKKRIIEDIFGGMAVESVCPLPPAILDNKGINGYRYDPDLAASILRKYPRSKKLLFHLRIDEDSALVKMFNRMGEYVIEDLSKVGIECAVERYSHADTLRPDILQKCDMYISRWMADTGDPDNFLRPLFSPDSVSNGTRYNNPVVNEKLDLAQGMVHPGKRAECYHEIQKLIVDDAPWIFLLHPQWAIASRQGLSGLNMGKPRPYKTG
jgi:ABC-type transport system substrate-binding protein